MKTIKEISEERGIDRSTLLKAAQRDAFGDAAKQSGATWLINDESEEFKTWLASRNRPGVTAPTIEVESPEPPSWLRPAGRILYNEDIGYRMDCERYGDRPEWRNVLNREAERVYNPEV